MIAPHHAAQRLDAQRQRRDVEQQQVVGRGRAAGQNLRLHRRAQRDDFVGIQLGVRLLAARAELKSSSTSARTAGMRVDPPTSTTSSICSAVMPASSSACLQGPAVRSSTGSISCRTARAESRAVALAVGQLDIELARPARSERRSWRRSRPCARPAPPRRDAGADRRQARRECRRARWRSAGCRCRRRRGACRRWWRCTSKMPSCSLRMEMSKVPPPKS
jgi:hypothetical protein